MITDRYSMSDKNLYGAEDDDDLDAIYSAMDKLDAENGSNSEADNNA